MLHPLEIETRPSTKNKFPGQEGQLKLVDKKRNSRDWRPNEMRNEVDSETTN